MRAVGPGLGMVRAQTPYGDSAQGMDVRSSCGAQNVSPGSPDLEQPLGLWQWDRLPQPGLTSRVRMGPCSLRCQRNCGFESWVLTHGSLAMQNREVDSSSDFRELSAVLGRGVLAYATGECAHVLCEAGCGCHGGATAPPT